VKEEDEEEEEDQFETTKSKISGSFKSLRTHTKTRKRILLSRNKKHSQNSSGHRTPRSQQGVETIPRSLRTKRKKRRKASESIASPNHPRIPRSNKTSAKKFQTKRRLIPRPQKTLIKAQPINSPLKARRPHQSKEITER